MHLEDYPPLLELPTQAVQQTPPSQLHPDPDSPDLEALVAWDDSKSLAFSSLLSDFLVSKIVHLDSFADAGDAFLGRIRDSWVNHNRTITTPALRCLEKALRAFSSADADLKERVVESCEWVWENCYTMGKELQEVPGTLKSEGSHLPFTQDSLVAYVDILNHTRSLARSLEESKWTLQRLTKLVSVLKDVLTYNFSPEHRPDIDNLTPVQVAATEVIQDIDMKSPGVPSSILHDLSEYATLPFIAAFDVPPSGAKPQKRVSYIALSKKTMPQLVDLFLTFKENLEVYADGTLEVMLSTYSIPIKLKHSGEAEQGL